MIGKGQKFLRASLIVTQLIQWAEISYVIWLHSMADRILKEMAVPISPGIRLALKLTSPQVVLVISIAMSIYVIRRGSREIGLQIMGVIFWTFICFLSFLFLEPVIGMILSI